MSHVVKSCFDSKYVMPAEWDKHSATWTSWPFDDELWFGLLEKVRSEFADLVHTISQFEPVHLLVRDQEALESAKQFLKDTPNVTFHSVPLDDVWFRDNGPIFVKNQNGHLQAIKWEFNSWGQKFEWLKDNQAAYEAIKFLKSSFVKTNIVMEGGSLDVNGEGVALTTSLCLLSPMRNPNMTSQDIEACLKQHMGIEKLLWLDDGLEGDHTDGHIDTIVRFVDAKTIVYSMTDDVSDPNHKTMADNYERLKTFTDCHGQPFRLVSLPLPKNRMELEGDRLPCTYANFYIGNGFVVVPQYDDPHDELALDILKGLFPSRQVIGLKSKYLICGGGSFHCVTQQQPVGDF